jgi:excisionase family DNA binding protein
MNAGGRSDWLTLGEASKYLGVAPATTRKWSDQGRLPVFYTPGGHRRFQRAILDEFISGAQQPKPMHTRPLVLVVEDDLALRETLQARLVEEGYDVRSRSSTRTPLGSFEEHPPRLVLLDVASLGSQQWELLQQLQRELGPVPMIMFDGRSETGATPPNAAEPGPSHAELDLDDLVEQARQTVPLERSES